MTPSGHDFSNDRRCSTRGPAIWLLLAGLVLPCARVAIADDVFTRDGKQYSGKVNRESQGYVITRSDGTVVRVPFAEVSGISLGGSATSRPDDASAALASLARSMEATGDPALAVKRYEQFIKLYGGKAGDATTTAALEQARTDLAVWNDRQARHLIRIGTGTRVQWITADERDEHAKKAADKVGDAVNKLRRGDAAGAAAAMEEAELIDPASAPLHFVRGVLAYRKDQFAVARKEFEAANASHAGYGPTLNNLAVTLLRINAHGISLTTFEQAMVAMPEEQGLLANVGEALGAVPPGIAGNALGKRVTKKYEEQMESLAKQLLGQGLYRWGNTFIDHAQHEQIVAAEHAAQSRKDTVKADGDLTQKRLMDIDRDYQANTQEMQRLEAQQYTRDSGGNLLRLPLPNVYFELQANNTRIDSERQRQKDHLQQLAAEFKAIDAQMPRPKLSGVLQIYSADAAPDLPPPPIPLPLPPTSQPTTQASTQSSPQPTSQPASPQATQPSTLPSQP